MAKIIKTKFYCKCNNRFVPRSIVSFGSKPDWRDNFIEGKWYDGEYHLWYDEDEKSERNQNMYRINGTWKKYKVINEKGELDELPISHMNLIFEMKLSENRNLKIEEILKNKN
jgi:hypothetical protein